MISCDRCVGLNEKLINGKWVVGLTPCGAATEEEKDLDNCEYLTVGLYEKNYHSYSIYVACCQLGFENLRNLMDIYEITDTEAKKKIVSDMVMLSGHFNEKIKTKG